MFKHLGLPTLTVFFIYLPLVGSSSKKSFRTPQYNNKVHLLYYPYYGYPGHVELAIENSCWNPKSANPNKTTFSEKTELRKSNDPSTLPFYSYEFKTSQHQIEKLKKHIQKKTFTTRACSYDSVQALSRSDIYTMPKIFSATPLLCASYLSLHKKLGSKQIKKIKLHTNQRGRKYIIKGPLKESLFCITMITALIVIWSPVLYSLSNGN